jgi:hypothetical protein
MTQVVAASAGQILRLEAAIGHIAEQRVAEIALARRTERTLRDRECPHCNAANAMLHGTDGRGRQRLKCRGCGRTFNILTGTPMARARKPEKWAKYLGFMTCHVSVRGIVRAGAGVNHVTAWRWRHRFLHAAAGDGGDLLSGVVETAWTLFDRSFKGDRGAGQRLTLEGRPPVPVLSAADSGGGVFDTIAACRAQAEAALAVRVAAGSVLCSVGGDSFARIAERAGAEHWAVGAAGRGAKVGRLGLERVGAHHRDVRQLVYGACLGVATKHLGNYLGWQRAMTRPGFQGKMLLHRALA